MSEKSSLSPRLVLVAAGLVACVAVGAAAVKKRSGDAEPPAASAQPADVATTITQMEARLKANPDDAEGWRMLGLALFESGKYAESAQAYGRATQLKPNEADYWSSLGEARVMAGPGDMGAEAKAAFDRALVLNPKDPRARYFTGVGKDMGGDHRGAIADWIALLRDTPAGAPWEADVRALVTKVAAKEKIDISKEMASLRPAPPSAGEAMANAAIPGPTAADMRAAAGMPKGQQDMMIAGMVDGLEAKLRANPDNPQGWVMLLRSRMQLGETAKAAAALRNARSALAGKPQLADLEVAARELGVPR